MSDPLSPDVTHHAANPGGLTDRRQRAPDTSPAPEPGTLPSVVQLSLTDAARWLGVSDRTVRRWADKGKLPEGWRVLESVTPLTFDVTVDSDTLKTLTDSVGHLSLLSDSAAHVSGLSDAALHLRAEKEALLQRIDEATAALTQLQLENNDLRQRLSDAERRERSYEEQAANLRVRIAQLEGSEASLTRAVTEAGQLVDWLKGRVEEGERQRESLLHLMPKALPEPKGLWGRIFGRRGKPAPEGGEMQQ